MKNKTLIKEIEKNKQNNPYYKNNPEMFDILIEEVFKNIISYGRRFKSKKLQYLVKQIESQLCFINDDIHKFTDYPINECIYFIFYGITNFPKCPICGKIMDNPKNFLNIYVGFTHTCSKQCGELYRQQSYINTCIDRYGVPHYAQNKKRYEERCDNLEKKYGVRNVFQLESTKLASRKTKKKKYGSENYTNIELAKKHRYERYDGNWESEEAKLKRKNTFIKNYGVDNPMKSEIGKKKYADGIEKKYGKGIRNISQVESIKQKKIETCQKNYGVDSPLQSKELLKRFEQSCIDLYDVPYPMQNPKIYRKAKSKYLYDEKYFASAPELAFYIWLKDNNIEFEYQPSPGFDYIVDDKVHKYLPDFKIDEMYFEIKGDQFFDKNGNLIDPYNQKNINAPLAKQKCMMEHNVIILRHNEYRMFLFYINEKYGVNYLKQFKQKVNNDCNEKCN